jgi:uncharacterized protein (DUF885 family)
MLVMKILPFVLFSLIFIGCGGGSSSDNSSVGGDAPLQLAVVPDYQLVDTSALLADITDRLNGLPIQDFFAESFQVFKERNTQGAVADGIADQFPLGSLGLTDISDDYDIQTTAIESLILDKLLSFDRSILSESDQLSFDVYQAHLEFQLEWAQYRDFEYPATFGFFGWPGSTEQFFTSLVPINNKFEAETYLILLNQLGRRFDQISELLDTRKAAGIIEPASTLGFSRDNVQAMANTAANATSYYTVFQQKVDALTNITDAEKQNLIDLLLLTVQQRVLPAYSQLAQKMTGLVNQAPANIGYGQFEGGLEFYDFALRFFTSSDQTSDEIHALGLQELDRIHAEMRVLFDQLGYPQNETMTQLFARVDSDGGTVLAEDAVAFYEDIITQANTRIPEVFSTIPQRPVIVVGGQSGGFYIRASDDGSRPAEFHASTVNDLAYTTQPTLAYHEAIPGHHLQIALAQELDLPEFRRRIGFTSFIEGWALYAERLAKDLGWYEGDVFGDLGRLQFEAMRAARLVVDTGIHNKGWSWNQADQFHIENVGFPGSIARYSVWPGQATAYMTGMLKILELRQRAQDQLGSAYDVKEFHSEVIGSGSMPTDLLEGVIDRYIQRNLPQK